MYFWTYSDEYQFPFVSVIKVTISQGSDLSGTVSAEEAGDPPMADLDEIPPSDESEEVPVRSKVSTKLLQNIAPTREGVYCLPSPVDDKTCVLLHDTLKILFNQTLGWVDEDCEEVSPE